jgi:hypothetical protein
MATHHEDAYEKEYMLATSDELAYRERLVAPGWYHMLFLLLAVLIISPGFIAADLLLFGITAIGVLLLAFFWMLTAIMRVHLSAAHLHIQLGLAGPKIATDRILTAEQISVRSLKTRGWGVRKMQDGTWYYGMHHGVLDAVQLTYADEHDEPKTVVIATQQAQEFIRALHTLQPSSSQSLDFSSEDSVQIKTRTSKVHSST